MNNIFDDTIPASLNILPMYAQSDYSGKSFLYENFDYFTVKIQRFKKHQKTCIFQKTGRQMQIISM